MESCVACDHVDGASDAEIETHEFEKHGFVRCPFCVKAKGFVTKMSGLHVIVGNVWEGHMETHHRNLIGSEQVQEAWVEVKERIFKLQTTLNVKCEDGRTETENRFWLGRMWGSPELKVAQEKEEEKHAYVDMHLEMPPEENQEETEAS